MDSREALTIGLVGQNARLYQTSGAFRTAIDTLVQMLPVWVEGFAKDAAKVDERMNAMIKAQLRGPLFNGKVSASGTDVPPLIDKE